MVSRWAYEALVVKQYAENDYKSIPVKQYNFDTDEFLDVVRPYKDGDDVTLYDLEFAESHWDYRQAYYIPEVNKLVDNIDGTRKMLRKWNKKVKKAEKKGKEIPEFKGDTLQMKKDYKNLVSVLDYLAWELDTVIPEGVDSLNPMELKSKDIKEIKDFVELANGKFSKHFSKIAEHKDNMMYGIIDSVGKQIVAENGGDVDNTDSVAFYGEQYFTSLKNDYTNKYLNDIMRNSLAEQKIFWDNDDKEYVQVVDPIFKKPESNFFSHFYAPKKKLFGSYYGTFGFNLMVIWIMGIILYITLYFEGFKKALNLLSFGK